MIDLKYRSYQKELLDADDIPFEDIRQTMKELNNINTLLGGHNITVAAAKKLISKKKSVHICEIGCGGGDNMHAVHKYTKRKNLHARFTGIDIKKECTDFAKQQYPEVPAKWMATDYRAASFSEKPDIVFSSLFCHHFTDDQMIEMLQWMKANTKTGFFINDLQRNYIAYYLIKWLTAAFSRSYLVKNDACISVARGFHKKEWQHLFEKAGITNYQIQWKWAFRYLVIFKHD